MAKHYCFSSFQFARSWDVQVISKNGVMERAQTAVLLQGKAECFHLFVSEHSLSPPFSVLCF